MIENFTTPSANLEVPSLSNGVLLNHISPRDAKFDYFKRVSLELSGLYQGTGFYDSYALRLLDCGNFLEFVQSVDDNTGEARLKLKSAHFCHVPRCPLCQWRRTLMWRAKAFQLFPSVFKDYPKCKYIFLTLTVKNCHVTELRDTLSWMNKSWIRLSQLKSFPGVGWVKTLEVTRQENTAYVHPHFHCLLMVLPSYFSKHYLSQDSWTQLWKKSLRVEYNPIVDVRTVKSLTGANEGMLEAVLETFKYSVKSADILSKTNDFNSNQEFLIELTAQLHKTRSISTGGLLKEYLKEIEKEPDDLVHSDLLQDEDCSKSISLFFQWNEHIKHYGMKAN